MDSVVVLKDLSELFDLLLLNTFLDLERHHLGSVISIGGLYADMLNLFKNFRIGTIKS